MNLVNLDDYRDATAQQGVSMTLDDAWAELEAGMEVTGGGAMVIVPAWRETFYGPVEEVRLPDGDKLTIALSHRIPDGKGLLITPKGADDIEVRLCTPVDEGNGLLSFTTPEGSEPPSYRWVAPGPRRPQ